MTSSLNVIVEYAIIVKLIQLKIFQESGEFCLQRWQDKTYPNI
jgi:hypothetical protein